MNSFGTIFKVTLYGESHQKAIGIVLDGMPAGIKVNHELIEEDLSKRKSQAIGTTKRVEKDEYQITSGVFNGFTTGSPIHVMIENLDTKSKDYENLVNHPRPGHADFVSSVKYKGFQDYRGGGRFSGRLTAPLVIAGSFAKMMLPYTFSYELKSVGKCTDMTKLDQYIEEIVANKDSVGGIIEVRVKGINPGLGEPFFGKVESLIGQMLFSIPAVKGVEFGTGFQGVHLLGSEFNDVIINSNGTTKTNHSGGINGGITNGNDLLIKVFMKPASSIGVPLETYHFKHQKIETLKIEGRHDSAIVRRAGIVLENAVAIVLADLYLLNKAMQ